MRRKGFVDGVDSGIRCHADARQGGGGSSSVRHYPPPRVLHEVEEGVTPLDNETLSAVVDRLRSKMKSTAAESEHADDYDDDDDGDGGGEADADDGADYGNHTARWDQGHSSWEEFGHENDPDVCRMMTITPDEWERGKYWRHNVPVMVSRVLDATS